MKDYKEEYTIRNKYQKPVDYEQILFNQMNRIANNRSGGDLKSYIDSLETLIFMLPMEIRKLAAEYKKKNDISYGLNIENKKKYDQLWEFVNEILEERNLIFRTSYVKTFG